MDSPTYRLEGVIKAETMEDFVGPLDLILLLLSKNKIEIKDIKISLILEQYLDYLDKMEKMDLTIAGEFIAMASYLLQIKTKMLLAASEEEAELSEMELLIQSLEQRSRQELYQKVKEMSEEMSERGEKGQDFITKPPEPLAADNTYRYEHDKDDLIRSIITLFTRSERRMPPPIASFEGIVGREPYPVQQKTEEIIKSLIKNGIMRIKSLFKGSKSRSEVVATFVSILELCRRRAINLAGDDENCTVTYIGEGGESDFADQ